MEAIKGDQHGVTIIIDVASQMNPDSQIIVIQPLYITPYSRQPYDTSRSGETVDQISDFAILSILRSESAVVQSLLRKHSHGVYHLRRSTPR